MTNPTPRRLRSLKPTPQPRSKSCAPRLARQQTQLGRCRPSGPAYAADWRDSAFCARIDHERLPADPETLTLYLADLACPATAARNLEAKTRRDRRRSPRRQVFELSDLRAILKSRRGDPGQRQRYVADQLDVEAPLHGCAAGADDGALSRRGSCLLRLSQSDRRRRGGSYGVASMHALTPPRKAKRGRRTPRYAPALRPASASTRMVSPASTLQLPPFHRQRPALDLLRS